MPDLIARPKDFVLTPDYRYAHTSDFAWALHKLMRDKAKVRRKSWHDSWYIVCDQWDGKPCFARFGITSTPDTGCVYGIGNDDIFAEDWELYTDAS